MTHGMQQNPRVLDVRDPLSLAMRTDEIGVRLEIVAGRPMCEAFPGCEAKDLEIGQRFYLSQGVTDVVVFDPETAQVVHYRRDGITRGITPMTIDLECGCAYVV